MTRDCSRDDIAFSIYRGEDKVQRFGLYERTEDGGEKAMDLTGSSLVAHLFARGMAKPCATFTTAAGTATVDAEIIGIRFDRAVTEALRPGVYAFEVLRDPSTLDGLAARAPAIINCRVRVLGLGE